MSLEYGVDEDRAVAHGLLFSFINLCTAETSRLLFLLEVLGIKLHRLGFKTACHVEMIRKFEPCLFCALSLPPLKHGHLELN